MAQRKSSKSKKSSSDSTAGALEPVLVPDVLPVLAANADLADTDQPILAETAAFPAPGAYAVPGVQGLD